MQQPALERRSFPPVSSCSVADSASSPGPAAVKAQGRLIPWRPRKLHGGIAFPAGRFRRVLFVRSVGVVRLDSLDFLVFHVILVFAMSFESRRI